MIDATLLRLCSKCEHDLPPSLRVLTPHRKYATKKLPTRTVYSFSLPKVGYNVSKVVIFNNFANVYCTRKN
jgi:hypothetical protein